MIWKTGRVEEICQYTYTQKGPSNEPGNFRPITLESVPLKIFTACTGYYFRFHNAEQLY